MKPSVGQMVLYHPAFSGNQGGPTVPSVPAVVIHANGPNDYPPNAIRLGVFADHGTVFLSANQEGTEPGQWSFRPEDAPPAPAL